jgi:hypothetical protein
MEVLIKAAKTEFPPLFGSHDRSLLASKIVFGKVRKKKVGATNVSALHIKYDGLQNDSMADGFEWKSVKPICFNCRKSKQRETCKLQ